MSKEDRMTFVDCDEGRICPKCGKVMILREDMKTYHEIWECDECGYNEKLGNVNKSQIDFLKPCPFCGSDLIGMHIDRLSVSYIRCDSCDARIVRDGTHCSDASTDKIIISLISKWNKRKIE